MRPRVLILAAATAALNLLGQPGGPPNTGPGRPPVLSLKAVPVPYATGTDLYVRDYAALITLGKVFFWDVQAGSDGKTACATCHFHAGADHRLTNQLSGDGVVPNRALSPDDFPFHQFTNPNSNQSPVLRSQRQVAGSAGVVAGRFLSIQLGDPREVFDRLDGALFRQVTARNTPSVINAVFNFRNFWDGRAREVFTGATPFGNSDAALHAWLEREGELKSERVSVEQASLASQAVGPALDATEMSFRGRQWIDLGRKLLALAPLARQAVALDDSVLGNVASPEGRGLRPEYSYRALIASAFHPAYWESSLRNANGDLQMEANFALFWGLALQAYQSTLISDDTPFDRFVEGDTNALTPLERQGLTVFTSPNGQCSVCHAGPEFSAASVSAVRRQNAVNSAADLGFFRLGVRPVEEDLGIGGQDGFGVPLFNNGRAANARGAFKAPGLRNVEFTGPYFHNGGKATLEEVIDFYARRGDFPGNVDNRLNQIQLGPAQRTALVAFLKALTDERVRYSRAPFDHPSLCVPDGHEPDGADRWLLVEATGRGGALEPLQSFAELLRDGHRSPNAEASRALCALD